jgi:hypothetical protein
MQEVNEVLEDLRICKDSAIDESHKNFGAVRDLASECLRILNIDEDTLYKHVLKGSVHDHSLVSIVEDTPELRDRLIVVEELKRLYEQLRLMKLEGRVYDVLDDFFNQQLDRTL